jgi:hypothetical protein
MVVPTSAAYDIELTSVEGTVFGLSLVAATDERGNDLTRALSESLSAAQADSPLADMLEPEIQERFDGGVGVERTGYRQAPGVYTRDGYACPAGYATDLVVPSTNNSTTPIVSIAEYGNDLWFAQVGSSSANTARVMRSAGKTGAVADSLNVGANSGISDLVVADDGAGTSVLWASGNDASGGFMRKWDGSAWSIHASGTFGLANKRNRMKRLFWRTNDNVGAHRIVVISGLNQIAYTVPNADPLLAASWVEGVRIDTAGYLRGLAAARQHVWVGATDNLYDLTADGDSPGLEAYGEELPHPFMGYAVHYHDNYVYHSSGQGLMRVFVGNPGELQELPGQCAPGWFTSAEHEYRGYVTAMCSDQGYLVAAVFNPSTGKTGIFWGKDRRYFPDVETRNPLVWFGPEVVSGSNVFVTAMRPVAVGDSLRLYIAASGYDAASTNYTNVAPNLAWVSLPIAGSPLDDQIASGSHRFATGQASGSTIWQTFSRLHSMPLRWKDTNASKFVHEVSLATRGLDAATTTKLTAYLRADPAVGSTSYSGPQDITTNPSTTYTPTATTAGRILDWRVDFFSPSGNATPPKMGVLEAVRITAIRRVPAFRVLTLTCEAGDGVTDLYGGLNEAHHPDDIKTHLVNLTLGGRSTIRTPDGKRWTFFLRQVLDVQEELGTSGPYGKRIVVKIQAAIVGAAS